MRPHKLANEIKVCNVYAINCATLKNNNDPIEANEREANNIMVVQSTQT